MNQAARLVQVISGGRGRIEMITEVAVMSPVPVQTVHEAAGFRGQIPVALL